MGNVTRIRLMFRQFIMVIGTALGVCLGAGTIAQANETVGSQILQLINTNQFDEARALFQTQNPTAAEQAFFEGRVLKVQGRLDEAIAAFRQSITLDPSNMAARRELAHTLLLDGQYDTSEYFFETLLDIDPNLAMHDGYRRFLSIIRQNKPFGVNGHFALIPSSNINRGTTNTVFNTDSATFVIDAEAQEDAGVGVQIGVSGFARMSPDDQSRWTLLGSIIGTGYEAEIHNNVVSSVSLSYGRGYENGRWSLGPYLSHTWREDDADQNIIGLQFGINHRLGEQTSLAVIANQEYQQFPNQSYKDGPNTRLAFTLGYQFDPSLAVRGTVKLEVSRPEALHLQFDGYSFGASLSKAWEGGLSATLSLDAGRRDYVGIYPLTSSPRGDDYASVAFSVQNSQFRLMERFTPRLTCSHTVNRSNVAFFDYNTTECQAALTTEF